jgi:hypothetical protein
MTSSSHTASLTRKTRGIFLIVTTLTMIDCSVYMEANRPTPVDLTQFHNGDSRENVLEKIGTPQSSGEDSDGANCDFYRLYTHGYGNGGKVPIALLEGAADVVTLGLAEVLLTPTEAVTKNEEHRITFCYKDQKLTRMLEDGNCISGYCDRTPPSASVQAQATAIPVSSPTSSATPAVLGSPVPAKQGASTNAGVDDQGNAVGVAGRPTVGNPTSLKVPDTENQSEDWQASPAQ